MLLKSKIFLFFMKFIVTMIDYYILSGTWKIKKEKIFLTEMRTKQKWKKFNRFLAFEEIFRKINCLLQNYEFKIFIIKFSYKIYNIFSRLTVLLNQALITIACKNSWNACKYSLLKAHWRFTYGEQEVYVQRRKEYLEWKVSRA